MKTNTKFANKVFLIGGVPRSGKSILSERLYSEHGIQYISTDTIRFMLQKKFTDEHFSIDAQKGETKEEARTKYMWVYLKSLILTQKGFTKTGYCIEGVHLTPGNLVELKNTDGIRMVFLGYADADADEKFKHIKTHRSTHEWLADESDEYIRSVIEHNIEVSRRFRDESEQLGLTYIETSQGFKWALDQAYAFLLNLISILEPS